jgi:uncharacterized delta-60 repeat protein
VIPGRPDTEPPAAAARVAVAAQRISLGLIDGSGLVTDANGRVLVSGAGPGDDAALELAGRLPGGPPDSAFGAGGLLPRRAPAAQPRQRALDAIAADGSLLPAGHYATGVHTDAEGDEQETGDAAVVRLGPDRRPDTAVSLVDQDDGRILVLGWVRNAVLVARLGPDRAPDPSFGTAGLRLLRLVGAKARDDHPTKVLVEDNVRIVSALSTDVAGEIGEAFHTRNDDFALIGPLPDGTLDPAFGRQGVAVTRSEASAARATARTSTSSRTQRSTSAGRSWRSAHRTSTANDRPRRMPRSATSPTTASIDPSAGRGALSYASAAATPVRSLGANTSDGRMWTVGYTADPGEDNTAVARLSPDGSPDAFGRHGIHVTPVDRRRVDPPRAAVANGRDFLFIAMVDTGRRPNGLFGGALRLVRLNARQPPATGRTHDEDGAAR